MARLHRPLSEEWHLLERGLHQVVALLVSDGHPVVADELLPRAVVVDLAVQFVAELAVAVQELEPEEGAVSGAVGAAQY
eukprot:8599747-Pyramimonas_sp.AAC.1